MNPEEIRTILQGHRKAYQSLKEETLKNLKSFLSSKSIEDIVEMLSDSSLRWEDDRSGSYFTEDLDPLLFIGVFVDGSYEKSSKENPLLVMDIFYNENDDATPVKKYQGPKVKELYDRLSR